MKRELRQTADGSHTLYVPALQEHYHSINGALQESNHIFIKYGLNAVTKTNISILEVGFGTGLNASLSASKAASNNLTIQYTALEKYPLESAEIQALNYPSLVNTEGFAELFLSIHQSPWGKNVLVAPGFSILKHQIDLADFSAHEEFDVIYFDAFAPAVQPELWTAGIFSQMFKALKPKGILVTYCAQGQVKRNMKAAGLTIERLPGPPGKREITRARKG